MYAIRSYYDQDLILKIPVNDNVLKYAVQLAAKTRPNNGYAADISNQYLNRITSYNVCYTKLLRDLQ